jgi:hypothetical protein
LARDLDQCGGAAQIVIETNKKIYYIEPEVCAIFLQNLMDNVILLYQNFDKLHYAELKPYIDEADVDLRKFIGPYTLYDERTRERAILRFDIADNILYTKNSCSNYSQEQCGADIVDVLLKLEIAYNDVINGRANKRIRLTKLHKMMNAMGQRLKTNIEPHEPAEVTDFSALYDITGYDIVNRSAKPVHATSRNVELSQDINSRYNTQADDAEELCIESEAPHYKFKSLPFKKIQSECSQVYVGSEDNILSTGKQKKYRPFCNINKIREERLKKKKLTTDMEAKRSLQNDYDYLDSGADII